MARWRKRLPKPACGAFGFRISRPKVGQWSLGHLVRSGSKAALTAPKSDFRFPSESGLNSDIAACPKGASNGLSLPKLFNHLTAKRRCRSPDQGSPFGHSQVDDKFERGRSLNRYFGNRRAAQILIICRLTCVRQMPTMRVPYAASPPASAISRSEPGARDGDRSSAFCSNCE
jgi:hypothetical protein